MFSVGTSRYVLSACTSHLPPRRALRETSTLRERTAIGNREKIIRVLRRSPVTPLTYTDLKVRSGVPVGSFDRTLAALVRHGMVLKGSDGYCLGGDGSAIEPEETRARTGIRVYCARCDGSHPRPDKASGETLEDVHRRAIAP